MPAAMPPVSATAPERARQPRRWSVLPSLSDILFVSLMWLMFVTGVGWITLLGDGDTGMHIRTGELILTTHQAPVRDPYAFTAPDKPWYAWEWLADVAFGEAHRLAGLKGVVLLSGIIICLAITIVFRHMIWRGEGTHIALLMSLVLADALRFHYLARPHIFTTLLAAVTFWMLDRDWEKPGRSVWLLVPIAVLWVNLHGGFLVLIVSLALFTAAAVLRREPDRAWRYGKLTAACAAATLINPYGWNLHVHIWEYLRSDWLVKSIDEFQSPAFRSEGMFKFELLLFAGFALLFHLIRTRRYHEALLIVFWAHAALISVRHVTIYAIAAAPPIAAFLQGAWERWTAASARSSIKGVVRDLVRDLQPKAARTSVWAAAFVVLVAISSWGGQWPKDFPSAAFPTAVVNRNASLLNGPGHENARILSQDYWGGYLIYKFYPNRHLFIDGRSDYFGPKVINDYTALRGARDNWEEVANRYKFQFALVPRDWALAGALKRSPEWTLLDKDERGFLFARRHEPGATL
ncbi:MAG TPA: hypothetical protein VEU11_08790 [Terriglobales bacterium]|nr:hypothetical protein [Terriglobales bacterium]